MGAPVRAAERTNPGHQLSRTQYRIPRGPIVFVFTHVREARIVPLCGNLKFLIEARKRSRLIVRVIAVAVMCSEKVHVQRKM